MGALASEFVYVEASGALVAIGTSGFGKRVWRLTTEWQEVVTEPAPTSRVGAAFAYDSHRGVVVMFGGYDGQHLNETWEFDGSAWLEVAPTNSPSPRAGSPMTYDPVRQVCLMYGGGSQWGVLDDTWQYDGVTWAAVVTSTDPKISPDSAMVFDGNHQQPLLIGPSQVGGSADCETYRYDGNDWHPVVTAAAPSFRTGARVAFDPVRNTTVLCGGWGPTSYLNPTDYWIYDGSSWNSAGPNLNNNLGRGFAFWPLVGGLVAVGGAQANVGASGAAHVLTLYGWTQLTPEPVLNVRRPLVAYDSHRECIVLHGGSSWSGQWIPATWEWRKATGWMMTSFGVGPHDAMVYDPVRQRIVAVEGGQTFEYDGTWTVQQFAPNPVAGLIWYDRHLQRVRVSHGNLLWTFDGQAWSSESIASTTPSNPGVRAAHWSATGEVIASEPANSLSWRFNGYVWTTLSNGYLTQITEAPLRGAIVASAAHGTNVMGEASSVVYPFRSHEEVAGLPLATDVVTGDVYAVGRKGEVWCLDWIQTPAIGRYGTGCVGSSGIPDLRTLGALPSLGVPVPLQLVGLPASPGSALLMVGDSIENWNGVPLPIALDGLGLPGCHAWIAGLGSMPVSHLGGATILQFPLPATPVLAGEAVGLQALVFDPASNAAWASLSNALLITAY